VDSANASAGSITLHRDLKDMRNKLVFARDTGLLLQTDRFKRSKGALKSEFRVDYLEYKLFNGIAVPSRTIFYQNDKKVFEKVLQECSLR